MFSALKKAFPKGNLSKGSEDFVLEFDGSGQRLNHWQSPFGFHIYGHTKEDPHVGVEINVWFPLSNGGNKELLAWSESNKVENVGGVDRMVGFRNMRFSYDISKDERKIIAIIKTLKTFFEK